MKPQLTIGRWLRLLLIIFAVYGFFVQVFFLFHFIHGPALFLSRFIIVPTALVTASDAAPRESLSYSTTLQLARGAEAFDLSDQEATDKDAPKPFDEGLRIGVHRLYVEQLADELGVEVPASEVAAYQVDESAIATGLQEAKWSVEQYRKYIVAPLLLLQKAELAVYSNDDSQLPAKEELESLVAKVEEGIPFSDVALYFSQDPATSQLGGSFELMATDEIPDWLAAAANLAEGERSQILSGEDAYWVVQVAGRETIGEQEFIQFRGIAVKKMSLGEIIAARREANPPVVFVW